MRGVVSWLLLAALPWPAACSVSESFACNADAQCVTDAAAGRCEPEGVCSFPDEACPSGHRYGGLAGELSGDCVGSGSSSDGTTTTDPVMTSDPPLDSLGDDSSAGPSTSTTSPTSSTSTTAGSTTEPPGSTSEPGVETATATTDASTTTEGSTTDSGPGADPYGPCNDASDCPEAGSTCFIEGAVVCAPPCMTDDDCPPALGPASAVVCMSLGDTMGCLLICEAPDACPDGMRCEPVKPPLGYCAWG